MADEPEPRPRADDTVETPAEPLRPGEDPRHPGDSGPEQGLGVAKHPEAASELERRASEAESERLRAALADREADLAKVTDTLKRVTADFDNYRKRIEREREEARRTASEGLVQRLLDVMANFDRAVEAAGGDENAHEGITLIYRQFREILRKEGVERIDTTGHPFDPRVHEAVMREEAGAYEEGTILQEFEAGWTLHGRVIRPAKVKVASRPRE